MRFALTIGLMAFLATPACLAADPGVTPSDNQTVVKTTPASTATAPSSDKDRMIELQAQQIEAMKKQQELQAAQIKEMQLQRQELAHQTEQQAKDAQHLRWVSGRRHLMHNLIFDPPRKVQTSSTVSATP